MYTVFPYISVIELEPMTSWSQGNNFTGAPGLPFG
jgi:hypothetical protein